MRSILRKRESVFHQTEEINHCAGCELAQEDWIANNGLGYLKEEWVYCCEGCAENTGCLCMRETS